MDAPPASISTDDTPSSPPGTETSEAKKEGSSSGDKRSITDEPSTDEETPSTANVEPEAKKAKTPSPTSKDKKEEVSIKCAAEKKEGEEMHKSEDDKASPVSSSKKEPDAEEEGVSADTKKENE
jgi:hypothetical protein